MESPRLTSANFVSGYTLRLAFSNGTEAEVDFEKELAGGVFDALRDPEYFRSFSFHEQFGTIEWDNGADFSPEFLYEIAQAGGQQTAGFDARSRSRKSA